MLFLFVNKVGYSFKLFLLGPTWKQKILRWCYKFAFSIFFSENPSMQNTQKRRLKVNITEIVIQRNIISCLFRNFIELE